MSDLLATADLNIPQGNDRRFLFTVRDTAGNLVDISGATEIRFAVSRSVSAANDIEKTLTGGGVVLADNNTIQVDVTDVESGALPARTNYYDLKLTDSVGKEYTLLVGDFRVREVKE